MVLFTLFFTLGVWLLQQQAALPNFVWAWLLAGLPLALLIPTRTVALRLARALLIAAFACGSGFYWAAWQGEQRLSVSVPGSWQGRDIIVVGVVAELPHITERGQRFKFTVEKTLTPEINTPKHIYLSTYSDPKNPSPTVHAGERWQLTTRLKQPHGSSNPHGFDFELWALENNIRAVGYVHNTEKLLAGHPNVGNVRLDTLADGLFYRMESWREAVRNKFNVTLGHAPYAGILTALAVGDQDSISQAQWQLFRRTGVVHLMSISGLHITMLSGMGFALIYWLWRRSTRLTLWLPARKAAAIAALLTALVYGLLAGFGVPAQRTVYMVAAVACALWLNRNFSLGQILSIALTGVLIPDPWAVLSPGFWLSFGAVALILYTTSHRIGCENGTSDAVIGQLPGPTRKISPSVLFQFLRQYAVVQWAVTIGLIPLLLALFGQVSLVSPVANAIAIPLVSLMVVPLALTGAVLPIDAPLWLAHSALHLTMIPLQFLSNWPLWTQHAPHPWSIVSGMLGVAWMLTPRGFPARWLGGLMLLPMFLNSPEPPEPGALRLIVFDVGQGLSAAVQTRHHALLYDTGPDFPGESDSGNRILIPSLRGMGIASLDGLILSHDDTDHIGGTVSVLQAMPVGWIASSQPVDTIPTVPSEAISPFDKFGTNGPVEMRRCRDGMSWNWDGVQFDILHPDQNSVRPHDNNQSCVLRISTGHQHILLAGDIEKRAEQRLLNVHVDQLPAGLLVVPHHGSSGSSGANFVAAVLPDYAVFTSGYLNRFGHPKEAIRQRYIDSGATLLRSDEDGAILIDMNANGMAVERYRKTHSRYWTHMPTGG
jgi:competence protein ComEC